MPLPCQRARLAAVLLSALLGRTALAASAYAIVPQLDHDMCFDVTDKSRQDGAPVQLWQRAGTDNQTWTLEGQAIKVYGNMCLDVVDGIDRDGTTLQIWACEAPNANQRFERFGNLLRWVGSSRCVDVPGGRARNATRPQLWSCNGSNKNQAFAFVEGEAAASSAPVSTPPAASTVTSSSPNASASAIKLQSAGTFLGFRYIALATFLNKHPVLKPLRQDIIDAAASAIPPLPPSLLAAMAMQESSGNPAVKGGLMQFTWAPTWAAYGRGDIHNGRDSLFAAARYLSALLQEHEHDLAAVLRAYNGEANGNYVAEINSWLTGGFPYGPGT